MKKKDSRQIAAKVVRRTFRTSAKAEDKLG